MSRLALASSMLLAAMLLACSPSRAPDEHAHGHAHEDMHEDAERGPHGGRLMRGDAFTVELAIHEQGVPPEFRAWVTREDAPVPPKDVKLTVTLQRLGQPEEVLTFAAREDYLLGSAEVHEPHSFDVRVDAELDGRRQQWTYASYEGRTTIPEAIARQSGIFVAPAAPGTIRDEHDVQGLLTPIEGRHAKVVARFPGPIRDVRVGVGDTVQRGQTLATIESNLSLSTYAVTAPLTGTVLSRDAGVGELAGDAPLFEIADLSKLWVDLHLFGGDAQHITRGLAVRVTRLSDGVQSSTTLDRILPATATASQSTVARATLDNQDGRWRPGAAVKARVTVSETPVDLVVPLSALQRFREWDVVFIQVGDVYEVRPLALGQRDGELVEVVSGLRAGDLVVIAQSYLIKADIEKAGASHDH